MSTVLIVGSVARDELVRLDRPLRLLTHNQGHWIGPRIGGGAANTAMALARHGNRVRVISAVAPDADGDWLVGELTGMGVDVSLIARDAELTTRSMIFLEPGGERTIVNLGRARLKPQVDAEDLEADCLFVRSTDPALSPLLERFAGRGLIVAHVPPVQDGARPAQVLVGSAGDLDASFLADPYRSARRVAGDHLQWMVVTHGSDGAVAYGAQTVLREPAPQVPVCDTTGAGDAFAGGLLHVLGRGGAMALALRTAVAWGAASVQYEGTVPPAAFPGPDLI